MRTRKVSKTFSPLEPPFSPPHAQIADRGLLLATSACCMPQPPLTIVARGSNYSNSATMATPKREDSASGLDPTTPRIVLRNVRLSAAPYLPPPVLSAIHITDSYLHVNHASFSSTYCYSEPSVSILSAVFSAYVILRLMQGLQYWWTSTTKRSTAHLSGEEDAVLSGLSQKSNKTTDNKSAQDDDVPLFDETVVFCGASGAGKTVLLHCLCNENDGGSCMPPMTATSLVANVAYISTRDSADVDSKNETASVRLVDYPGHPSLSTKLTSLLLPDQTARVVFTIDATKPVTDGVAILYKFILTNNQVRSAWKASGKKLSILIVCTKEDDKKAKNHKRMKIQIRNELDRLRKVDSAMEDVTGNGSTPMSIAKGKAIDLDNLGPDMPELHFVETGLGMNDDKNGLKTVRDFVRTGEII